jgi:uncharacterized protein YndB with AHSA1/START domain
MPEKSVHHHTFTIKRTYPAAPDRVFAAFRDPVKKRQWFAAGEKSEVEEFTADFQVGGREYSRFRFQKGVCENHTLYQEIQPDQYIVLTYTMSIDGRRISSSQATFELLPDGKSTHLIFTDQGAYFEGADGPAIREEGWSKLLAQMEAQLSSPAGK